MANFIFFVLGLAIGASVGFILNGAFFMKDGSVDAQEQIDALSMALIEADAKRKEAEAKLDRLRESIEKLISKYDAEAHNQKQG